jgi:hypothetical protein
MESKMSLDSFRPFISGIIGAIIASVAAYALEHWHLNISKELQEHLNIALTGIIFVIISKSAAKYFNPGDAASKHLIPFQTSMVKDVRAAEKAAKLTSENNVQKLQEEEKNSH